MPKVLFVFDRGCDPSRDHWVKMLQIAISRVAEVRSIEFDGYFEDRSYGSEIGHVVFVTMRPDEKMYELAHTRGILPDGCQMAYIGPKPEKAPAVIYPQSCMSENQILQMLGL